VKDAWAEGERWERAKRNAETRVGTEDSLRRMCGPWKERLEDMGEGE
jgi:anti-sigma-K factor RskA